jgi:hypothetical protein
VARVSTYVLTCYFPFFNHFAHPSPISVGPCASRSLVSDAVRSPLCGTCLRMHVPSAGLGDKASMSGT